MVKPKVTGLYPFGTANNGRILNGMRFTNCCVPKRISLLFFKIGSLNGHNRRKKKVADYSAQLSFGRFSAFSAKIGGEHFI